MANTISKQTILDGDRNLVVKVTIVGDNTGDESATQLIDMSTYAARTSDDAPVDSLQLLCVSSSLEGWSARLLWDATADVDLLHLPSGNYFDDFQRFGGIPNNAGAGVTGDINITTVGLGTENGHLTLHFKKKYAS